MGEQRATAELETVGSVVADVRSGHVIYATTKHRGFFQSISELDRKSNAHERPCPGPTDLRYDLEGWLPPTARRRSLQRLS
jgi:hypothetical protein